MIAPFGSIGTRALATNKGTGLMTAIATTAVVLVNADVAFKGDGLYVAMVVFVWIAGLLFAFVLGRSGLYADGSGSLIVVNLLRAHRFRVSEVAQVVPDSPLVPGPIVFELTDGRLVKAILAPSVRSGRRQDIYEFVSDQ